MKRSLLILCNMLMCFALFSQTQSRVTGTVTSTKDGTGIIASVLVKATSQGVATDANGKYVIENVPSGAVLIFTSVGFRSAEVPVSGRSVVNVALEPDVKALDEIIMVAYGTATKGTYTGSASVINQ
ncbi:MAG TPA: carboxypeptidase-like regulatory domain-containing protein, partial [Hanamia sp.]|nr:carboxypeptidase-like regulatory domain-containing protein [Hanamia sp.]